MIPEEWSEYGMNIRSMIKSRSPTYVYAALASAYFTRHSGYGPTAVVPRDECWLVCNSNERYYTTDRYNLNRGSREMQKKKLDRYKLEGFVKPEPSDTVVDIGAFVGEFTLACSRRADRVIAFEPARKSYVCLENNTKECENVISKNILISCEESETEFKVATNPTESSIINVDQGEYETNCLKTKRLDSLLKDMGVDIIDYLKVDAEGAEPEVLKGCANIPVRKVAVDAGEERSGEATIEEVSSVLSEQGFEINQSGSMIFGKCALEN